MWNYTEMYSASLWPSGAAIVSANAALAEIHLSMIRQWGEVQRDIIKRYTTSVVDVPATRTSPTENSVAASADQTSNLEDGASELNEQSPGDAPPPEDTDAGSDETDGDQSGTEVSAVDERVPLNAAMAILNNPALAAEAATRGANDVADYEVRDDVADDIAAEIQREVRQEFSKPNT